MKYYKFKMIGRKEPRKVEPELRNEINNSLVETRILTSGHYKICRIITTCFRIISDHSSYDMIETKRNYKIDLPSRLSLVVTMVASSSFLSFNPVFLSFLFVFSISRFFKHFLKARI